MQDINGDKKCLMDKKAAFSVSLPNSTINEITAQCPDGMSPARWKELIIRRGLQALTASVMDTDMERLKSEMELQCKQSMDALKGSHASDIEKVKTLHASDMERLKSEMELQCKQSMDALKGSHASDIEKVKTLHASDMERLKSEMELQCKQSMDALKGSHASDMEDYKNGNKLFSFIDANVMLYLDELCDKYDMDRKKGIFTCIKYSLHCEKTHLFRRSFQSFIKQ